MCPACNVDLVVVEAVRRRASPTTPASRAGVLGRQRGGRAGPEINWKDTEGQIVGFFRRFTEEIRGMRLRQPPAVARAARPARRSSRGCSAGPTSSSGSTPRPSSPCWWWRRCCGGCCGRPVPGCACARSANPGRRRRNLGGNRATPRSWWAASSLATSCAPTLALLGGFTIDIVSGRGWVCIALVIFGQWGVWPGGQGPAVRTRRRAATPARHHPRVRRQHPQRAAHRRALPGGDHRPRRVEMRGIRYPGAYLRPYRRA